MRPQASSAKTGRLGMTLEPLLGSTTLHRADVSLKTSSELCGNEPCGLRLHRGGAAGARDTPHFFGIKGCEPHGRGFSDPPNQYPNQGVNPIPESGFMVLGSWLRVWGVGCRVHGMERDFFIDNLLV